MKAKKQMLKMLAVVVGIVLLAQVVPAGADEVTLGYDRDLVIRHKLSNNTNSVRTTWWMGTYTGSYYLRGLMAFDLSDLLAGDYSTTTSTVESITLKLSGGPVGGSPQTLSVYAVSQAEGDWSSSTAVDDLWAAATSGSSAIGSYEFTTGEAVEITISGTDLTALVNGWINGENAGFYLVGTEDTSAGTKYVSVNPQVEQLVVNYTVPEPATMAMLGLGGVMMFIRRRRAER